MAKEKYVLGGNLLYELIIYFAREDYCNTNRRCIVHQILTRV